MLYGTTRRFLEVFGLENLKNLPTLRELDEMAREQGLIERANDDALAPHEDSPTPEGDAESAGEEAAADVVDEQLEIAEADSDPNDPDEDPAER